MSGGQRTATSLLALLALAAGVAPWFWASDVAAAVMRQEPVLLGRYTLPWFQALALGITPACWLLALYFWARRTRSPQAVRFRAAVWAFGLLVALGLWEGLGRLLAPSLPLPNTTLRVAAWPDAPTGDRQPVRARRVGYEVTWADVPPTARSYPDAPPGVPTRTVTLTTDARGYRNPAALDAADVITLGAGFTEGVGVTDEETWPARVRSVLGGPLYNLGLAGAEPGQLLAALRHVGAKLQPRVVVLLWAEGADLAGIPARPPGVDPADAPPELEGTLVRTLRRWIRTSPIRRDLAWLATSQLGGVGADAPIPGYEPLAWMPVELTTGSHAAWYTFRPRDLLRQNQTQAAFEAGPGWKKLRAVLRAIQQTCTERGIRLVLSVAPSKLHVLLPVVRDRLPPAGLLAFARCADPELGADAAAFAEALYARLDARERALAAWCARNSVSFVSLAGALRARMRAGAKVYFTYTPHWTAEGHAVVARRIIEAIQR